MSHGAVANIAALAQDLSSSFNTASAPGIGASEMKAEQGEEQEQGQGSTTVSPSPLDLEYGQEVNGSWVGNLDISIVDSYPTSKMYARLRIPIAYGPTGLPLYTSTRLTGWEEFQTLEGWGSNAEIRAGGIRTKTEEMGDTLNVTSIDILTPHHNPLLAKIKAPDAAKYAALYNTGGAGGAGAADSTVRAVRGTQLRKGEGLEREVEAGPVEG